MDCENGTHRQVPPHHLPGNADCCVANVCAMNLALPASPSGIAHPPLPGLRHYDLRALLQPIGIDPTPIPHPPKSAA